MLNLTNEQRLPPGSLLRDFTQLRQKAEQSFANGQRYNFSNYDIMLESDYNSITGQELVPGSWYVNFDANQNKKLSSAQPNQGTSAGGNAASGHAFNGSDGNSLINASLNQSGQVNIRYTQLNHPVTNNRSHFINDF